MSDRRKLMACLFWLIMAIQPSPADFIESISKLLEILLVSWMTSLYLDDYINRKIALAKGKTPEEKR